jgi:hypothetical protein
MVVMIMVVVVMIIVVVLVVVMMGVVMVAEVMAVVVAAVMMVFPSFPNASLNMQARPLFPPLLHYLSLSFSLSLFSLFFLSLSPK